MNLDGHVTYHCFNCGFKAAWQQGKLLSENMKKLLGWLGASDEEVKKLAFKVYQLRTVTPQEAIAAGVRHEVLEFKEVGMPKGAKTISEWAKANKSDPEFLQVVKYVMDRGEAWFNPDEVYWTPTTTFKMNMRFFIPFKWQGKIVGWTGRTALPNEQNRYFSNQQPHYLFNNDVMYIPERKYVIVVEGPLDALAIDGVATMGAKTLTSQQVDWLKHCGKEIIIVPDRDARGSALVDAAIANGWSVSYPWGRNYSGWERDVKDAADAVKKYGRLFSLRTILDWKMDSVGKIKTWQGMMITEIKK